MMGNREGNTKGHNTNGKNWKCRNKKNKNKKKQVDVQLSAHFMVSSSLFCSCLLKL